MSHPAKLDGHAVRWRCDPAQLGFKTTRDIEPAHGILGQEEGLEALRFAIESRAFGQNAYIRGLSGTGRMSMVTSILTDARPFFGHQREPCYVMNFEQPDRPRLISLAPGESNRFRHAMTELARYIEKDLPGTLDSEAIAQQRVQAEDQLQQEIREISAPFESALKADQMAMLRLETSQGSQLVLAPVIEGKIIDPASWQQKVAAGEIDESAQQAFGEKQAKYNRQMEETGRRVAEARKTGFTRIRDIMEHHVSQVLDGRLNPLMAEFDNPDVEQYLRALKQDVIDQYFYKKNQGYEPQARYAVNVLLTRRNPCQCPIVTERVPSLRNLLGTIESKWGENGPMLADHMSITAGSLLHADGGFLVLDAREVLSEPGAWKILVRTLKNRLLEIVPAEMTWPFAQPALKPEPIPVNVRVLLLGDAGLYHLLDNQDRDFPDLFKVLVDFDTVIDRNPQGFAHYAAVIAKIIEEDELSAFTAAGVAALIEHGARICAQKDKLTARFSRVADIAREAHFVAQRAGATEVDGEHVIEAVKRTKRRAGLPARKYLEQLANGTINIETDGARAGQINGLAVIHAGPIVYGFPSRITASVGAGRAGVIDIEEEAGQSGAIHTKGFKILGGLLRYLLPVKKALTFSASVAFEQSYGGIDGDSASGAEFCCLISALTRLPIDQGISMTGAIDQHGRVQAIGGVNEKIEGFYDVCRARGLSGRQGVIIPASNAGDLMLRHDVLQACIDSEFSIWAVASIQQAMELLMGRATGELRDGQYPPDSILGLAMQRAEELVGKTRSE